MIREYKTIKYTEQDMRGFSFHRLTEEEIKELCLNRRKNRNKTITLYVFFCIAIMLVKNIHILVYILGMSLILFLGLFVLLEIHNCRNDQKKYRAEETKCIHVKIMKKLPVETAGNDDILPGGVLTISTQSFYPVIGKDITTGYESKCYTSKETYNDTHAEGKIINVIKTGR